VCLLAPALSAAAPARAAEPAGFPWPRLPFVGKKRAPKPAETPAPRPDAEPRAATREQPAASRPASAEQDTLRLAADSARRARSDFADSWFWGAKGGAMRFGTITEGMVTAPSAGADWLITRQRAALLVGFDQLFFDRTSAVRGASSDSLIRVSMKNARRFSATLLAAPKAFGGLRPYVGAGLALELVDGATPRATAAGPGQVAPEQGVVDDASSRMAFQLLGGAQYQLGRAAIFVQGTMLPAQNNGSLWNFGKPGLLEAGLRFNLSSAIDRF
jgi:opacity protein-like surface antigen